MYCKISKGEWREYSFIGLAGKVPGAILQGYFLYFPGVNRKLVNTIHIDGGNGLFGKQSSDSS